MPSPISVIKWALGMGLFNNLANPIGRIGRAQYLLALVVYYVFLFVVLSVIMHTIPAAGGWPGTQNYAFFFLILLVPTTIKRFHDRNKSGWWFLPLFALPIVLLQIGRLFGEPVHSVFVLGGVALSLWAFVELCFLRGASGPNRFGPDPLDVRNDPAA